MELEQYDEAVHDFEHVNKLERGNPEYRACLSNAKLELKKSKRKDYYKILGVEKNANDDEIKKAYRYLLIKEYQKHTFSLVLEIDTIHGFYLSENEP